MHPRFSVVIPTRERAATLPYTLRTCLDQDFDDYEIVVCDNHSSPATRAVVDAVRHPRIRYVRAPHPLAMSDNWELAVEHARGEYVTVLGDDDALLSHALGEVDRVIARTGARAIRWVVAFYTWPAVALEGEGNYLGVPLMRELHTVDAVTALDAVIGFRESYGYLPMLYNGVIHRDLIAELRQKTGRVFRSPIPDIYSGMAFAYLAGSYVSLDVPMAVSGISGTSNGVANMLVRGPTPVAEEFRRLNAATGLRTHPHVPDLSPVVPLAAAVADSFQHAKDALFPTDNRLTLDRRLLAEKCVQSLWAPDEGTWQTRLGRIRATFADDPDAQAWFDREHANAPFRPAPPPARAVTRPPGYDGSQLHLRADAVGVTGARRAGRLRPPGSPLVELSHRPTARTVGGKRGRPRRPAGGDSHTQREFDRQRGRPRRAASADSYAERRPDRQRGRPCGTGGTDSPVGGTHLGRTPAGAPPAGAHRIVAGVVAPRAESRAPLAGRRTDAHAADEELGRASRAAPHRQAGTQRPAPERRISWPDCLEYPSSRRASTRAGIWSTPSAVCSTRTTRTWSTSSSITSRPTRRRPYWRGTRTCV